MNTVQGPNGPLHLVDLNQDGKVSRSEKFIAAAAGVVMLGGSVLLGALVVGMFGGCGG